MSARWTRLAELIGVNSIPVIGVLAGDWSPATALTVYWFENLFASVLIALRLALHERWRDPATVPDVPEGSSFAARRPGPFLLAAIPFGLAHGVMLAAIFAFVLDTRPDTAQLMRAVPAIAALQALAFGTDLWTLADWPVARLTRDADYMQGRVVAVHLSLMVGMFLFAYFRTPAAFFGFFIGVKVLSDLSRMLPQLDQGTPDAPPRWLAAIMRRIPAQNGETFEEYWRRTNRTGGPPPRSATGKGRGQRGAERLPK